MRGVHFLQYIVYNSGYNKVECGTIQLAKNLRDTKMKRKGRKIFRALVGEQKIYRGHKISLFQSKAIFKCKSNEHERI